MEEMQKEQGVGNVEDMAILSRVVRVGLSEKVTGKQTLKRGDGMSCVDIWNKVSSRRNNKCKGPEAET